jgi:chemotaxis protein methyltransferase CheR
MQNNSFSILIVEGADGRHADLANYLRCDGYQVEQLVTCALHPFALHENNPQLILLDLLALAGSSPAEQLRSLSRLTGTARIPIIILAPDSGLEFDLLDVYDYLSEPIDLYRLQVDIERLVASPLSQPDAAAMPETELDNFRAFIGEHSGLHFSRRNNRILQQGLHRRMCAVGVENFSAYHDYLIRYSESRNELKKLLSLLTIGETSFFRYSNQRAAFLNQLIPDLIQQRRQTKTLRIWSAGCSTGEEPYGIAMLLAGWTVQILATDINKRSLRTAREGIYRKRAVRLIDKHYLKRYFESVEELYVVNSELKKRVRFEYLNLKDDSFPSRFNGTADIDLIFCRNVMIYFETETTRQIVDRFADCLKPGGYLLLGHSETLQNISERFNRLHHDRAFFYQSMTKNEPATKIIKPAENRLPQDTASVPVVLELPDVPDKTEPDSVEKLCAQVSNRESIQTKIRAEQLFHAAQAAFLREDVEMAAEDFAETLQLCPDHLGALIGQGLCSANRGDYDTAHECCDRAAAVDDLCPDIYFLRGMVCDMESRPCEATIEYQKVLWLDSCFIVAHYALSRLYRQGGDLTASRRALLNTVRCLEKSRPSTRIHFSGGMTREVFLEQCRNDLDTFAD